VEGSYGFLFGNGIAAAFLKEYYRIKVGPVGAFLWVVSIWGSRFFGSRLYSRVVNDQVQTITADGGAPIRHSTVAVFCSTVMKMPLGYALFYSLKTNPDRFQCVSLTFAAKDAVWQLPLTMVKRRDGSTKGKMTFCCHEMTIEADAPFGYTLDGELYVSRTNQLRVGTGPDLEFITI
jgi:hypothetical protein